MRRRRLLPVGGAVVLALALVGCAPTTTVTMHFGSTPRTATPTPTQASSAFALGDDERPRCLQSPLIDRIRAADKSDQITPDDSEIPLPDDPVIVRQGQAAVAKQIQVWESLTPDQRLYQLCFRAFEAGDLR
jgi:hypothetical protein